ncbi:hypothetical protein FB381_4243 [Nocardioides albertanoniae]|uniref:Uncharacterized protein n=1 Tax=Nocardioides albertanoniae TaxID=1175486 RepID=A0A543ACK8_9ACTN|nr:hypothetical protein FB381_4243 [Nocardioides albertanoniae]
MSPVTNISGGNRVGPRRGTRPSNGPRPPFIVPAIATLGFLIIWGVLVWVAVGFGADARGGESGAWAKLAIAAVAAVACLFLTFTFAGKAWRALTGSPTAPPAEEYSGSHSNAYVEEQDYPDPEYPGQDYSSQDYYGTSSYGYEDTGSYGRHSTDTGSQSPYADSYGYDTGSQSPYGDTGNRSSFGDTGNRSSFGDTGNRSAYGGPTYQPPPPQPYYSNPATPASTPQPQSYDYETQGYDTQGYDTPGYGTGSYPTQQSGAYQAAPARYGQTGPRPTMPPTMPAADIPTQAMPTQRQSQVSPAPQEDEWPPPRRASRSHQWPPTTSDGSYRPRH